MIIGKHSGKLVHVGVRNIVVFVHMHSNNTDPRQHDLQELGRSIVINGTSYLHTCPFSCHNLVHWHSLTAPVLALPFYSLDISAEL